ncbi:UNVERIFIED_CONTAM: hypothetical protein Sradi_0011600 [Sesamum radiatum]|uniref:Reverse transcriptase/retrotransposon-derived protein RNase H-like domain-containing protein n=1 Tax=Sesamum radiatum TaxID=300843 RepID=A0AAW2WFZ5_SESRA
MRPLASLNVVHKLVGLQVVLKMLISCSTEYNLPFFKALPKTKNFALDETLEQTFQDLKIYLGKLALLTKPSLGDPLYLYLVVGQHVVSSVLIKEKEGNQILSTK